ncbi:MAG: 1-phosphofructokinase [Promethearchaeia archaeon]
MIYTVTLNPAVDRTIELDGIKLGDLNRVKSTRLDAGGKGINVSRVIHSLNGESIALGFLGGKNGGYILNEIKEMGISEEFIRIKDSTRMNIKALDTQTQQVTEFNEQGPFIQESELKELKILLAKKVKKEDFIVFSGSVPQNLSNSIYRNLIEVVPEGAKVILDAAGSVLQEGIKVNPYLIKPNFHEFCRLTDIKSEEISELLKAANHLKRKGPQTILLSMGEKGALYFGLGENFKIKPIDVEVKSTIGAGDALIAGFTYALFKNCSLQQALIKATACAAASISMEGTQPGSRNLVKSLESKVQIEKI